MYLIPPTYKCRYCKRDQEAELVLGILRTLHACFEAVDLDDAVLRLSVSLKLALLLEEQVSGVVPWVSVVKRRRQSDSGEEKVAVW